MDSLLPLAKRVGEKLKARKETVGVSESSAGGLVDRLLAEQATELGDPGHQKPFAVVTRIWRFELVPAARASSASAWAASVKKRQLSRRGVRTRQTGRQ